MADGTQIIVDGVSVHPDSGMMSIRVKAVTTVGSQKWYGPVKTYGIDANMYKLRFNRSIDQVLSFIASEHQGHNGAHLELVEELGKLKGRVIG
jgi:hypothetical protein